MDSGWGHSYRHCRKRKVRNRLFVVFPLLLPICCWVSSQGEECRMREYASSPTMPILILVHVSHRH